MEQPRILAFAGSLRQDSYNKRLLKIAANGARAARADVTVIDLRDYPLPVLNEDDERAHGLPAEARALKKLFMEHHGLLIASPEYNSSISAALKNSLDWVSRAAEPKEPPLSCYVGKTAALLSASPGALGGLRGLVHLRAILGNIRVLVLPEQQSIPKAHEAFTEDGALRDAKLQKAVEEIGGRLAQLIRKLHE